MGDGLHLWYNASSGTAGNTVSFTQAMTLDNSGNFLVGTSSATNASKINFYQSSSTAPVRFEQGGGGNGNQGYASWSTIVQSYPVVSSGTQLIIPFISQGNLNSCTIVRVRGIGARFNTNVPQAFTAEFAVGHLNALYNLTSWGLTGNAASVSSSGMNVIINFTSNYTASTQNGVFVVIEYLTSVPGYSINVSSIAMN